MSGVLRLGDHHLCNKIDEATKVPHVGGPGGMPTPPANTSVLANGLPILTAGDCAFCIGPPDKIVAGIDSVRIGGKRAADSAAATDHGGHFVNSSGNVRIG